MGGAAGAGIPPAGEGAAEADRSRASSATRSSATRWAWTASRSSSRRRSCTARTAIGSDPLPPGQVWGVSLGDGRRRRRTLPDRGDVQRPGGGVKILNQPPPARVPRKRQGRRAEPLRAIAGTGRRPQSPGAGVLGSDAARWMPTRPALGWASRRSWRCVGHCSARTRAGARSSSARSISAARSR